MDPTSLIYHQGEEHFFYTRIAQANSFHVIYLDESITEKVSRTVDAQRKRKTMILECLQIHANNHEKRKRMKIETKDFNVPRNAHSGSS